MNSSIEAVYTNCVHNFPNTEPCNGHGICLADAICLCDSNYVGQYVDMFRIVDTIDSHDPTKYCIFKKVRQYQNCVIPNKRSDPATVQCFLPRSAVWWMYFIIAILTFITACHLIRILWIWIDAGIASQFTREQYIDDVVNRPHLQASLCKLGGVILGLFGITYKLIDSSLAPIGLAFPSTLSYSLCWCLMFTDSLISLRFKLSAIQGCGGGYEKMLEIIARAHVPMMIIGWVCFSVAPVTFLFTRALKYSLADVVFALEAALFAIYAALIVFVVLYRLDIELQQSVDFLHQQIQVIGNPDSVQVLQTSSAVPLTTRTGTRLSVSGTTENQASIAMPYTPTSRLSVSGATENRTFFVVPRTPTLPRTSTLKTRPSVYANTDHRAAILTERLDKFCSLQRAVLASGTKNAIQYSLLFGFRLLCIIVPHWFIFILALEMVMLSVNNLVSWRSFRTDISSWFVSARQDIATSNQIEIVYGARQLL